MPYVSWNKQVLGGATFFISNAEARISSTTGLLIAITALYIIILGNIPFVGYATTIDTFVLVMLGMLAGIILVQVVYLLLFNYVYKSEDKAAGGNVHPILRPSSSSEVSLPFRYFMNMCCSSSLADDEADIAGSAGEGTGRGGVTRRPAWLLWFSSESSQLLGEVCVAAMIQEHQQTRCQNQGDMQQKEIQTPKSSVDSIGDNDLTFEQGAAAVSSVAINPTREKEIKKPIATFAMLGIEFCGRVFLIPFILLYTDLLMLDRSMNHIGTPFAVSETKFFVYILYLYTRIFTFMSFQYNIFEQGLAWTFLIVCFCSETWRLVSKYCELFVLTDPFQDKTETLTVCYEELNITCERLLMHTPTPGSLDVHLHILSYDRLEDIHVRVLQAQYAWLIEKCLCHQVPSAKELLLMAKRQARLLREHDSCKHNLQMLLSTVRNSAIAATEEKVVGIDVNSAAAQTLPLSSPPRTPSSQYNSQQPQQRQILQETRLNEYPISEEKKEEQVAHPLPATVSSPPPTLPSSSTKKLPFLPTDTDHSESWPSSSLSSERLHSVFYELLNVTLIIFRIYPKQVAKLRALYRPSQSVEVSEESKADLKNETHSRTKSKDVLSFSMNTNEDKL